MASVLVVCTGNVCRSPLAEGSLRRALLARSSLIDVTSAGTMGWEGSPADPRSVQAGTELGIDISGHVARAVTPEDLQDADVVVAMAREHAVFGELEAPDSASKTFTLKELVRLLEALPSRPAGEPPFALPERVGEADVLRRSGFETDPEDEDIADPLGLPLEAFRVVASELDEWCERLADGLLGRAPARASRADGG